jgi:MFS transporter, DHA1 family, inner membrane transport protein
MTSLTSEPSPPLVLFSLGNLVVGTGAFILAGILGSVSTDLGIGVPAAGQAMTAYALSTALLAPFLLVLTGKLRRKQAMALALALFAIGNLVCSFANSLTTLLLGRVLMGAGAMFTPIVAGLAVAGSPPAQRGKALSWVFLGISLSYVVGLPMGTWLTSVQSWRLPIQVVAAASLLMLAVLMWRVPAGLQSPGASFQGAGTLIRKPEVGLPLLLTLLYFTAIFTLFGYIGPVLQALGPMSVSQVSLTLLAVGVSGVLGTLIGGWATDRFGALRTLQVQLVIFLAAQAVVPLTGGHYAAILCGLLVWGTAGFGMMPPQQARLVAASPKNAPLLLSLNTSMLYFGTALGSIVGGTASAHLGFGQIAWAGIPFLTLGLLTVARRGANER